jgi:organic radical activating enzyme
MTLYVNEFCIGLHSFCNWNCKYCIAKNNNIEYNEDQILNEIRPIKHALKDVYLSGGEPGILSDKFWNELFQMTQYKLAICTNGTFILKNYHIKYEKYIREIFVHCVSELDEEINPIILDFISNKQSMKVTPNIVIHDKNHHLLHDFLKRYDNIKFDLLFTDSSFKTFHTDEPYQYAIQAEACINIFKVLSKFKKYTNYTTSLMKAIIKKDYKYLNSWSQMNRELI